MRTVLMIIPKEILIDWSFTFALNKWQKMLRFCTANVFLLLIFSSVLFSAVDFISFFFLSDILIFFF